MEQIRGRVNLNIDYVNNKNGSTQYNPMKLNDVYNLHHNKNHNIFEEDLYKVSPIQKYGYVDQRDDSIQRAVAFVQAANPNAIGNGLEETIQGLKREQKNSPGKSKNKLGALYNPNYVDPRVLPQSV